MNTELGNTTLESLGILTGIEGYRAALADPPNWQARLDGESQWLDYEDKLDNCWSVWDARMIVHDSVVQWRRKPDMKRDPMRYVVRPIELRDDMIVGEPNGHFVDVNLRLPFQWNRRVARITVEEIVDKTESIPLQPAEAVKEAETVTMTANETRSWLSVEGNAVLTRENGIWSSYEYSDGTACVEDEYGPFRPLTPATRSQVEMERELATVRDELAEARASLSTAMDALKKGNRDWTCANEDKLAAELKLASALGSQKAAVAALEVEREKSAKLRSAVQDCVATLKEVPGVSVSIKFAHRVLSETARKESGG